MSIFVSIASYRDPELIPTIKSAISMASNPEDIYFGVVCQELPKLVPNFSGIKNLSVINMHIKEARGAGLARAKALELYNNEDYYLQIDSHTRFVQDWDLLCYEQLESAKKVAGHNKVLLSYYPAPYHKEGRQTFFMDTYEGEPVPSKQKLFRRHNGDWSAKRLAFDDKSNNYPEVSQTILAGFIFASSDLMKEVPYDPEISFMGEELCFAMRAWTRGWDIYSPKINVSYHFYRREGYKKVWKDSNIRRMGWGEIESLSKDKQKRILCGIEQGIYGAGNVRSLQDFEKFVGFDFKREYGVK
jgi:hypothetical protein